MQRIEDHIMGQYLTDAISMTAAEDDFYMPTWAEMDINSKERMIRVGAKLMNQLLMHDLAVEMKAKEETSTTTEKGDV